MERTFDFPLSSIVTLDLDGYLRFWTCCSGLFMRDFHFGTASEFLASNSFALSIANKILQEASSLQHLRRRSRESAGSCESSKAAAVWMRSYQLQVSSCWQSAAGAFAASLWRKPILTFVEKLIFPVDSRAFRLHKRAGPTLSALPVHSPGDWHSRLQSFIDSAFD